MTTVLITGGNTGLGKEAAYLFSQRPEIDRVVITARDRQRGKQAITDLRQRAGGAAEFSLEMLDTSDPASVAAFADRVEPIDIAVLNAGGLTGKTAMDLGGYGVTNMLAANVTGHVDLVRRLIETDKIGERVVLVSSEAARGVSMLRIKPPAVDTTSVDDLTAVMVGEEPKTRKDPLAMYAHVKLFGSLWASAAARHHADLTIVSVSPGSTRGTEAANHMPFPMNKLMPLMMKAVMPLFGASHDITKGAQRYVDAALRDDIESGGFYASPEGKVSGDMIDQRGIYPAVASTEAQDTVASTLMSLTAARA